ncbi:MOSC domain-containing protein [Paracoccus denitrificans]|uniref:MOSC domain containing protein n=1 Tax=Paracoccus denitrificans (strain Pd 1222) TaxID=318586 RepID=A1B1Z3_PARDP|nr:MOSC domain-containing protein [Paracoccus denitrificans]ABL69537.1 MOSC domain containing protein [Paracoccus denitrificans PD1222]MBB4626786.1 MOSC domain-containing protein YiiM [Paracoccus denitrificans]
MRPATLLTGRAAPLPGCDTLSGIGKTAVTHPLRLGPEGFEGDEQADRRVHGGIEKAVHHYSLDHYSDWRAELGDLQALTAPGGFGENISTAGLTEEEVAVGDTFRLGGALIQVSQGRQPCWKLNHRFGVADMARRVQQTGRTGWYYRVLQTGTVAPGDRLELIGRLAPDWTLRRLWHALYVDRMNLVELEGIAALDVLAEGWRKYAVRRLESHRVEDWSARLDGTA